MIKRCVARFIWRIESSRNDLAKRVRKPQLCWAKFEESGVFLMLLIRVTGDLWRFEESNNVRSIDWPRNRHADWKASIVFWCQRKKQMSGISERSFGASSFVDGITGILHEPKAKCIWTVGTLPAVLKGTTPGSKLWWRWAHKRTNFWNKSRTRERGS